MQTLRTTSTETRPRFMFEQQRIREARGTFRIDNGALHGVTIFPEISFPGLYAAVALLEKGATSVFGRRQPGPATCGLASMSSCREDRNCVNFRRHFYDPKVEKN